jgi:flagellar hook assembly protein FlgD
MKTLKSLTAFTLLFATALSFAHTTPSVSSIQNNGASVSVKGDHKPYFRKSSGKLFMNFFNQEMGDVRIQVIDSENRIVFKETLKEKLVVEKVFNFSSAVKDSYKVIVKDGNETYSEYYVVK